VLSFSQTVFKIIVASAAGMILVLNAEEISGSQSIEIGIIRANNLNLRPGPGKENSPLGVLKQGTTVKILKHVDGWLKILHEGRVGYIRNRKQYVLILPDADLNLERLKKEAADIGRKIDVGRAEVKTFTRKETTLKGSINDIDTVLFKTRKHIAAIMSEHAALENKIEKTANESQNLQKKIHASEIYISKRLVALYKLSWLGRMQVLASAESIYDYFQREAGLQRILAYDEKVRTDLLENKVKLQKLFERLNAQKMKKRSLEDDLRKKIGIISKERANRSKLLADIRSRKSLEIAFIESLKQAATALNDTIKALSAGKSRPSKVFPSHKGLLQLPVQGKIVTRFGPNKSIKFNAVIFRNGIDITADRGEPIHAVCSGKVLYSSWFKGYGNMIIIDHGNNYHTVYAHIEERFKEMGESVETGEVIATVGDTDSMIGPGLYFEVRHRGKPLDPLQWIKKG